MIIGHGSQAANTFRVPSNTTIHFYADPGDAIQSTAYTSDQNGRTIDSSLVLIGEQNATPSETVEEDTDCTDYDLSKFLKSTTGLTGGRFTNWAEERSAMSYVDMNFYFGKSFATIDVISIRHRVFKRDLKLSTIVRQLGGELLLGYREFHCVFCRDVPTLCCGSSAGVRSFDIGETEAGLRT